MRYTTRAEAIERAILPALGGWAADYDVEGLAGEVLVYRIDHDAKGRELLDTAGFEIRADVDFWGSADRHETSDSCAPDCDERADCEDKSSPGHSQCGRCAHGIPAHHVCSNCS